MCSVPQEKRGDYRWSIKGVDQYLIRRLKAYAMIKGRPLPQVFDEAIARYLAEKEDEEKKEREDKKESASRLPPSPTETTETHSQAVSDYSPAWKFTPDGR
jgi:hypothetical protein